jgi:SAM-dependent methyltransferase
MNQPRIYDRLRTEILTDIQLERVHTAFRKGFLLRTGAENIPFMVSLACQCFNNEYIYAVSAEEQLALARLKENLASVRDLIVHAMYEPLGTVRDAAVRFGLERDPDAGELFVRQISEPAEEEEIKKGIQSFGVSSDSTSQAVREQYEESPYPRWIDLELLKPCTFQDALLERFPFLRSVKDGSPTRILIAGCGTGRHPITVAAKYPETQVTAIDLSKSSLAYAIRKARQYKIPNLNFLQGDILNLEMHHEFDAIEAVGVLHHMKDPVAGLRKLKSTLKPGGFMKLGLYSKRVRAQFQEATRMICERNIGTSSSELRDIRQEIIRLQNGATKDPTHFEDFYYMSGFRDFLCHAHEVSFYPAELKSVLEEMGLNPLGYRGIKSADRAEYIQRFPQDPYISDLDLFDAFESDHPDILRGGLQILWAQSK